MLIFTKQFGAGDREKYGRKETTHDLAMRLMPEKPDRKLNFAKNILNRKELSRSYSTKLWRTATIKMAKKKRIAKINNAFEKQLVQGEIDYGIFIIEKKLLCRESGKTLVRVALKNKTVYNSSSSIKCIV